MAVVVCRSEPVFARLVRSPEEGRWRTAKLLSVAARWYLLRYLGRYVVGNWALVGILSGGTYLCLRGVDS